MTVVSASLSSQGTDHHSGWYLIPSGTTATVVQYKQSITYGTLVLEGNFNIDGQLIMEV